ncbi:MAG: cobalt-precorrin-6A reductase [Proteobacteria bacterium]|nr:cobalt-precorrin-6A reductase [Pseudomonadota bacterium]
MAHTILILGGTTEARALANALAGRGDLAPVVSLAGRTAKPAAYPVPMRIGGFGGPEGLAAWLRTHNVAALIDATHPYAAQMSTNAAQAAALTGVPVLALRRPAWEPVAGDRWTEIAGAAEAVTALGTAPRRVFLALGRQELAPFEAAPQHAYLIRSVDPVEPKLAVPDAEYVLDRGPFDGAAEAALLARHRIEVIVAKNSGGTATYGKLTAARKLGIEVLLFRRPAVPEVQEVGTVAEAVAWLDRAVGGGR